MSETPTTPPPSAGLLCPRCGCRDLRATKTMHVKSGIRRYRKCRHCGRNVTTLELLPKDWPRS
mgnify:CR=1 FL=1